MPEPETPHHLMSRKAMVLEMLIEAVDRAKGGDVDAKQDVDKLLARGRELCRTGGIDRWTQG